MKKLLIIPLILFACDAFGEAPATRGADADQPPNILIILADDLGFGDVSCSNPEAKVKTPNIDALARQGMRFTDAHSAATVCTPTRYSLMTGQMCFRTGYRFVFTGIGGPCIITPERLTIAEMLKESGYRTAMVGKWHVGMTFYDKQGQPIHNGGRDAIQRIDFTRRIDGGPVDQGFDTFYGTACCPTTDWLYAFIENDRIPVPPTGLIDKAPYPTNDYTHDFRQGYAAPNFDASEVDLVFLDKSKKFLRDHVTNNPDQPFFLFHSMQAVHLPSIPAKRFRGTTQAGPHGDFIHEMDWIVGDLVKTLESLDIADNTLVVFCSDNGPEAPTVVAMRRDYGHDGARPWRGVKRDQWEGGHRTPLIVKWPHKVDPGSTSAQLISTTDLMATCAALVGYELPNDAAEDSYNMLGVLLGEQGDESVRPYGLQQTMVHSFSIRVGDWKYLDHQGSGGNDYDRDDPRWSMKRYKLPDTDPDAPGQLYNLAHDPGETTNLFSKRPEIVSKLKAMLDESIQQGRSAPLRGKAAAR
jgi:arylsulfatase A-like enzyme